VVFLDNNNNGKRDRGFFSLNDGNAGGVPVNLFLADDETKSVLVRVLRSASAIQSWHWHLHIRLCKWYCHRQFYDMGPL
jgi:hypothetical protein